MRGYGQAATTATFKVPGENVLQAVATDSAASTPFDVKGRRRRAVASSVSVRHHLPGAQRRRE
jgi:hypothetical protein